MPNKIYQQETGVTTFETKVSSWRRQPEGGLPAAQQLAVILCLHT